MEIKAAIDSFEKKFRFWNYSQKIIFFASLIAFLSLFMRWRSNDSGFLEGGLFFWIIFFGYPTYCLYKDELLNVKYGIIFGVGAALSSFFYMLNVSDGFLFRAWIGVFIFFISTIILLIGILFQKFIKKFD